MNFLNRTSALAVVCVFCVAGCSSYRQPALTAVPPRNEKPRIAALPVENLSGKSAPLGEIRRSLIEGVAKEDAPVMRDEDLERFMARHRIRYVGGIDEQTAQAFQEEAGVEAVLITSLEQYVEVYPPKIALTSRLVSTTGTPHILWVESISLAGDESPGLFGLGLIGDIGSLQKKALGRMQDSLVKFFSDVKARNITEAARYGPKISYLSRFMAPDKRYTIAVVPFFNASSTNHADVFMMLHFVKQLVRSGDFDVIEPGMVRQRLLNFRMIMPEGVSVQDVDIMLVSLNADFVLTGKVLEFENYIGAGTPNVDFNTWVFERRSKKMVWASRSYNRGTDGVFFFDWGKVNTVGILASKMAESVVRRMDVKDPGVLQRMAQGPFGMLGEKQR